MIRSAALRPRLVHVALAWLLLPLSGGELCELSELYIWDSEDPVQTRPVFDPNKHRYSADVDFDGGPLWIDPIASGNGCEARRGDAGQDPKPGKSVTATVDLNGDEHSQYSIVITKRTGAEVDLRYLALGNIFLSPDFTPKSREYSVRVAEPMDQVTLSCLQLDGGQKLVLTSGEKRDRPEDRSMVIDSHSGGGWRNFSLGKLVAGGKQLADVRDNVLSLPIVLTLQVFPADDQAAVPARVYRVTVYGADDMTSTNTTTTTSTSTSTSSTTAITTVEAVWASDYDAVSASASAVSTSASRTTSTSIPSTMSTSTTASALPPEATKQKSTKVVVVCGIAAVFVLGLAAVGQLHPAEACQPPEKSSMELPLSLRRQDIDAEEGRALLRAAVLIST